MRIASVAVICAGVLMAWIAHPSAQDPTGGIVMRVTVGGVSIYEVPGPPQGDFWDPTISNVFGILSGRASVYPDVVVCARPGQPGFTGRPSCTQVCEDVQKAPATNGQETAACQRPLRVNLPPGDPRLLVDVLEMNNDTGSWQVHAIIARNLLITDPTKCPDAQPCRFEITPGKAPLVLAFRTQTSGTLGTSTPRTAPAPTPVPVSCQPSATWTAAQIGPQPSGLHGPYASVDDAVLRDYASTIAYQSTRQNPLEMEYGFLIERDTRQPSGAYYTTPPVAAAPKTGATARAHVTKDDFAASEDRAFGSCDYRKYFNAVATVHTHPNVYMISYSFTADDFDQAIQLKQMYPNVFEKIVMIHAKDQQIRTFTPRSDDTIIGSVLGSAYMWVLGNLAPIDWNWWRYDKRVLIIGQFK